jgi:hypothetical protein
MADVNGYIGDQRVEFNNAATEATLKLLLQSSIASNKQSLDQLKKMTQTGGILDSESFERVNTAVDKSGKSFIDVEEGARKVSRGFSQFNSNFIQPFGSALNKISEGSGKVSDILNSLGGLPLGIGAVSKAFASLVKFQEDNFESYQKLTQAGANFGGSLSAVRNSAGAAYLTLDQLTNVVTKNQAALSTLGGSAEQNTKAFLSTSKQLFSSGVGTQLQRLGYTTEQVNEGMINYIANSGGRTRSEMKNTKELIDGTQNYLEQLDLLASITGKSRAEIADQQKEKQLDTAFQAYLLTLDPKEREKANALYDQTLARAGKGAAQNLVSELLGFGPAITKAGEASAAIAGRSNQVISQQIGLITDSTKTVADINAAGAKISAAQSQDAARYGKTGLAMIMQGGKNAEEMNVLFRADNQNRRRQAMTAEELAKFEKDQADEQKKRRLDPTTEVARQVSQNEEMFRARMALNEAIQKLATDSMPLVKKALDEFTSLVRSASGIIAGAPSDLTRTLMLGAAGLTIAFGTLGGILRNAGGLIPKLGRSGGVSAPSSIFRGGASGAIEGELAGLSRGGSSVLKGVAGIGTLATLGLAAKDYFDIEKKRKTGEISAEKAKREETKLAAETGGGLSGALALGTAGSVFGPIGTIVGGVIGGVFGTKIGKDIAESLITETKKKSDTKIEDPIIDSSIPKDVPSKDLLDGMNRLNTTMITLLAYMKATAANTERTYRDVENLKNKVW